MGRTHEGTGIGLALVDELVRLHGGTVEAQSVSGEGTTFTARIPFGSAHLPLDQVLRGDGQAPENTLGAAPFVQEALRWLAGGTANEESLTTDLANEDLAGFLEQERGAAGKRARVLLADDNRDMREYVQRLLARKYDVTAAADGQEALAAARESSRPGADGCDDAAYGRLRTAEGSAGGECDGGDSGDHAVGKSG